MKREQNQNREPQTNNKKTFYMELSMNIPRIMLPDGNDMCPFIHPFGFPLLQDLQTCATENVDFFQSFHVYFHLLIFVLKVYCFLWLLNTDRQAPNFASLFCCLVGGGLVAALLHNIVDLSHITDIAGISICYFRALTRAPRLGKEQFAFMGQGQKLGTLDTN